MNGRYGLAASLVLPLALSVMLGCDASEEQADASWRQVTETAMTPEQITQRDLALGARDDLARTLKSRLTAVMRDEGAAAAIDVCAHEAPQIAAHVAETHGVSIGRTSFRLRNPTNAPPVWAAPLIAERVVDPTYLEKDGALAALLPIRLEPACLTCHGDPERLAPEVTDALAELYPEDEATDFRAGELRGWFWVDVPASDGP